MSFDLVLNSALIVTKIWHSTEGDPGNYRSGTVSFVISSPKN